MTEEQNGHNAERDKLRELQAIFEKAVKNNTIEDIRPFTHPDFSFVSFTDKSFSDFDSFKQQWDLTRKNMVGNGSFTTQLNPSPTLFTDDTAIASGNAKNTLIDSNGQQYDFTNNWTVIFKRVNNEWKVLRAHNSLDPFNNPMLISGIKRNILKYCLFAFFSGAILCSAAIYLMPM
ncbi:hypothetical protein MNBD_GAMMA09-2122 [hydrothermal vent metagenome]|uniref:Calcium/calmodulin-dependent protein kinase II association-domain domain-containing protein n=1 Tax=hydrothermal vent metagenome TaxID=652676 RepID=A0A3B0XPL8_9ZZZZ